MRAALAGLAAAEPGAPPAGPAVLADRPDGLVLRAGDTVLKAHAARAGDIGIRLAVAAHPALAGILLPPLPPAVAHPLPGGRVATRWPYGAPLDHRTPGPEVPWEAAAALLARLHTLDPARLADLGPLPAARGPARAAEALRRLRAVPEAGHPEVRRAIERILGPLAQDRGGDRGQARGRPVLCHGDFHLGQLVRHPRPEGPWHLIDVDDLGLGDPAWDLARPAAWYAAGLLPAAEWDRLLSAYQSATGTLGEDPWPRLDGPARALTAQLAARALVSGRPPDEAGQAFADACVRIAGLP
ncbi:phosphotransferase family protein [Streptomyces hoynatensis]|uniref:phosphotransferase family protein n=1 Tax=Streptomyces hoynatensis TaxID=1141874 RepID=UPI003BAAA980